MAYQYSLDLLRQVINKAPRFFPPGRKQDMEDTLQTFLKNPETNKKQIDDAIIDFGKEIWPYRKAFWHIHDSAGRIDENEYLREALGDELQEKYQEFLRKGNRIEDIREGGEFEDFFTAEEKRAFIEAKLNAHNQVIDEIESLCVGEHRETCDTALEDYRKELREIEALLSELRKYATQSEKWRSEILDKVRTFEAGWSGLEREVTTAAVLGEIDYYNGIIELFE